LAAALWTLVLTAGEITITDVYQIRTFAEEIYTGFALGDELGDAQRRALPGSLLVGTLAIAVLWIGQTFASRCPTSGQGQAVAFQLGAGRWWAAGLLLLAVLILLGVPLGNLVHKAGLVVEQSGTERIRIWSVHKLLTTLARSPGKFSQEFTWSMVLGQLTALSTVVIAFVLAWYARPSRLVGAAGWTLAALALAVPGPLLALGVGRLVNQPDSDWLFYLYDRTLLVPWLVLLLRSFPCAYLLATIAVRQINPPLLAAAATDGAAHGLSLLRWLIPLLAPALGAVWLIALSLALGDLSASILAVPPGVTTVAVRVFNLVHYGVEDQLAGLCLWSALLFGVLTVATVKLICHEGSQRSEV
jgi:iron(III) transport system permease protein